MPGEKMKNKAIEKAVAAAVLVVFAAGAWAMNGMQGDVGKHRVAAERADHSPTAVKGQITEPLKEPIAQQKQGNEPSQSAAALPRDLHPTSVTITRNGKLQDVKVKPPQTYEVTDATLALRLYKSLLSLEFVPNPNNYFCPMDVGISYDLQFAADRKDVLHIQANASGCQFVSLDDGTAFRENDSFRQAMMDATGMNKDQLWGVPGSFK